jgi:hypothetical protein
MATDLATRITTEIDQLMREMDAQKRVIKKSLGNTRVIEAAEAELKALNIRLTVLKGNLKRLGSQEPEPA